MKAMINMEVQLHGNMMNKIIIALVLVVGLSWNTYAQQQDWRFFNTTVEGDINYYFEFNTLRVKDAQVFVWILHDLVNRKSSMKSLNQIDCINYRLLPLQTIVYDDNMGKGNATDATEDNEKFQYGVPGSPVQVLIQAFCGKYNN